MSVHWVWMSVSIPAPTQWALTTAPVGLAIGLTKIATPAQVIKLILLIMTCTLQLKLYLPMQTLMSVLRTLIYVSRIAMTLSALTPAAVTLDMY